MADRVVAYFDAENNRIVLQVVDASDAPQIGAYSSVVIDLDDGGLREIKLREWDVCIDNHDGTFSQKKAIFLSTEAY